MNVHNSKAGCKTKLAQEGERGDKKRKTVREHLNAKAGNPANHHETSKGASSTKNPQQGVGQDIGGHLGKRI